MAILRAALIFVLAGFGTSALAEQITCESQQDRTEACGTVAPGSSVRMVQQISRSPCIEGRTWGSNDDSIWVSGGCRAVFDVQPPYDNSVGYERGDDRRYEGNRYAGADHLRHIARRACIDQAMAGRYARDEIRTADERWLGHGMFAVDLSTPDGELTCTVDRNGNVQSIQ